MFRIFCPTVLFPKKHSQRLNHIESIVQMDLTCLLLMTLIHIVDNETSFQNSIFIIGKPADDLQVELVRCWPSVCTLYREIIRLDRHLPLHLSISDLILNTEELNYKSVELVHTMQQEKVNDTAIRSGKYSVHFNHQKNPYVIIKSAEWRSTL